MKAQLKEIKDLQNKIRNYDYWYHVRNEPLISDDVYDQCMRDLIALEAQYPESVTTDSPTQKIGALDMNTDLIKRIHDTPMMSLENAFSFDDICDFERIIKEKLWETGEEQYQWLSTHWEEMYDRYIVEPKYDGLACAIHYHHGKFVWAVTRGDGTVGEMIPNFTQLVRGVPLTLPKEYHHYPVIEIHGEVLLFKKDLVEINHELETQGKRPYLNCRNAAAGILRSKKVPQSLIHRLSLQPYKLVGLGVENGVKTQLDALKLMSNEFGLTVALPRTCGRLEGLQTLYTQMMEQRDDYPYDIDGMVIKVNPLEYNEVIGYTAKFPRYAIAWKFSGVERVSKLIDVEYQVGRTGAITPVATIEPVNILGTTIRNCTLHNFAEIARLDLMLNCHVKVSRAGDVIPKIVSREYLGEKDLKNIFTPTHCPCCNTILVKDDDEGVITYCPNRFCQDRIRRGFHHFVSRKAMNIMGLGSSILDTLIDAGVLRIFADIYRLTEEVIRTHTKLEKKGSTNLLKGISDSRDMALAKVLFALGIEGVGETTAKLIAKRFRYLDDIVNASVEEIKSIEGIGDVVAKEIIDYFDDEVNLENLTDLVEQLNITNPNYQSIEKKQDKGTIVITGSFEGKTRDDLKQVLENAGFIVVNSISKKVDYLVAGEKAGSKLAKAESLSIPVITKLDQLLLEG